MNKWIRLLSLLVVGLALLPTWSSPARAAAGGPVVLMGIDAEDGGPYGHGPIGNYVSIVNDMLGRVANGGSGILVIGANGTYPISFWNAIDSAIPGHPVTRVTGASNITSQSLAGYAMIAVVSDYFNTWGGLTPAENNALTARQADIAAFVNNGGGLLGFSSDWYYTGSTSYGYLAGLGSFTFNTGLGYDNITPTAEGAAMGITDAFDICCWHDTYVTYPSFLRVLAVANDYWGGGYGQAAAIGGGNVVISDIQLAPLSATNPAGTLHTVTATVKENNVATAGKAVTFTVLSGPNAGLTGTDTTDANGNATFSYTSTTAGIDIIEASFTDSAGRLQTSNQVTAEWTQTNRPPQVSGGGHYTGNEGSPVSLNGSASDPDNDPLTISWTYQPLPGGSVDLGATCSFSNPSSLSTTISCTDDGSYYVIVTASDGINPPVSDSNVVMVLDNVAPAVGSISAPTDPVAVNTTVSISAPFSDAGTNDTHTAVIDWGDGSSSAGSVSEANGAGTASGSHTYTAAGVYTLQLTVSDDDGLSDTEIFQYVVVYDPSAGFVTGGGWIDSPAGAYAADPSLTGKANFGFVSKYKKGATVPDGQTQFQFHAGGLNFHSTSYEWLVISGPKAQYKGSGTINGSGDYGFLLTANDGQVSGGGGVDRFRIKIWDKVTGNVVYDNQMGAALDADVTDAIEGGSIVIHSK